MRLRRCSKTIPCKKINLFRTRPLYSGISVMGALIRSQHPSQMCLMHPKDMEQPRQCGSRVCRDALFRKLAKECVLRNPRDQGKWFWSFHEDERPKIMISPPLGKNENFWLSFYTLMVKLDIRDIIRYLENVLKLSVPKISCDFCLCKSGSLQRISWRHHGRTWTWILSESKIFSYKQNILSWLFHIFWMRHTHPWRMLGSCSWSRDRYSWI